jgi:hypothetical protein
VTNEKTPTNKLHNLLLTLSHQERERLNDFLNSPYFNQNEELRLFYEAIRPTLRKTKAETWDDKRIWQLSQGSKKFNKARFQRLSSDLQQKTERFLITFRFDQQKPLQEVFLLQSLTSKNLLTQFPYALQQAKKAQNKNPYQDGNYYLTQFLIELENNTYLDIVKKRTDDSNLKDVMHHLDVFYLIHKLRCCCAILHYKNVTSFDTELDEILLHLQKRSYSHIPIIDAYYQILQTLINPEEEKHFKSLRHLLEHNSENLDPGTIKELYLYAIQYCIVRINAGQLNYYEEIFALYKDALAKGALFDHGVLSPGNFKNIITVGLRLREFIWVEKTIQHYTSFLPKKEQENAFTFNMARVNFFQKRYDKVLTLLQAVEYNDIFYMLDAKVTLIKTFYELKEYESLDALLDSFSILLRRKKSISQQYRNIYLRFIRFVKQIMKANTKPKRSQLLEQLEDAKDLADKGWLLEKAKELK